MHGNMASLVWKEYRQNRAIVWMLLVALCLPYALVACAFVWDLFCRDQLEPGEYWIWHASFYSVALAQLAIAMIGGNLIAGERADRSADFVTYLPISKTRSLAAKLLLVIAMVAAIWLPNVPVHWHFLHGTHLSLDIQAFELMQLLSGVAINGLLLFCVAWLCSSMLESPAISVCIALITPIVLSGAISMMVRFGFDVPLHMHLAAVTFWYYAIAIPLSVICFAIGTWVYMRRVEP
jgi:ABC-type transport system involved in multi-copper enzyme maturation permease subunit